MAALNGHLNVVRFFTEHLREQKQDWQGSLVRGDSDGRAMKWSAARHGGVAAVRWLLAHLQNLAIFAEG